MNHPETHKVRPSPSRVYVHGSTSPDLCNYCQQPAGADHKPDCVVRQRTVVVRMTVEYTISVPESFTADNIAFHRNDGTWCAQNGIDELVEIVDRGNCLCGQAKFEYVREATDEDDERDGMTTLDP